MELSIARAKAHSLLFAVLIQKKGEDVFKVSIVA